MPAFNKKIGRMKRERERRREGEGERREREEREREKRREREREREREERERREREKAGLYYYYTLYYSICVLYLFCNHFFSKKILSTKEVISVFIFHIFGALAVGSLKK